MKQSRKGVISMPIKLMVSFLILSLMVPTLMVTVENIQDDIDNRSVFQVGEELRSQLSKVNSKGPNFILQVELDIPSDSHIVLGGDDGRIISLYNHDEHIGNIYTEFKVIGEEQILYGNVILRISNSEDGIVVKEL
ncbi:MAG: hypothetical protein J5813_04135 [Candidatus Methanomethylophilaceae archaeon]|nr:hypothetical protein [Candidatus Methanomethylophilaceae archaeon]